MKNNKMKTYIVCFAMRGGKINYLLTPTTNKKDAVESVLECVIGCSEENIVFVGVEAEE